MKIQIHDKNMHCSIERKLKPGYHPLYDVLQNMIKPALIGIGYDIELVEDYLPEDKLTGVHNQTLAKTKINDDKKQ